MMLALVIALNFHLCFIFSVPVEDMHESGRGDTKDHTLSPWFINFSEADELLKLAAARQQVKIHFVVSLFHDFPYTLLVPIRSITMHIMDLLDSPI